ncbi:MAG: P-loop NTPase [Candidatus Aenigmarchaeota archaeon]|nr:P-loop NTPase [Candidatus Aenigmarchaeota archaeon]
MAKIIGVFSGKGGVGKTTCSINLGLAIQGFGDPITLIDCDVKNSNLGLHLGLYDFPITLYDVLENDINILEAMYIHSSGLRIIPASVYMINFDINASKFKTALNDLESVVMIDSPPGIGEDVLSLMSLCDEIVIITNPDLPSVTDALKTYQAANDLGKKIAGVLINRTANRHEIKTKHIEEIFKGAILGTVPEDRNVKRSIHIKVPLVLYKPHSRASLAFKSAAAKLTGRDYSPPRLLTLRRMFE